MKYCHFPFSNIPGANLLSSSILNYTDFQFMRTLNPVKLIEKLGFTLDAEMQSMILVVRVTDIIYYSKAGD